MINAENLPDVDFIEMPMKSKCLNLFIDSVLAITSDTHVVLFPLLQASLVLQ